VTPIDFEQLRRALIGLVAVEPDASSFGGGDGRVDHPVGMSTRGARVTMWITMAVIIVTVIVPMLVLD
jgi:hypothetical protein